MNNTLISILIFTLFLLPIAFAKFRLDIFAFEESGYLDSVTLSGKNTSEGEVKKMSRELNDPGSVLYCMGDSTGSFHTWTVDANLCKISTAFFAGVTSISFDHATKDPRPLNITIAETKMQCNITGIGEEYATAYWFLGWGLNADHGPVDIVCFNSTVEDQA